MSSNTQGSDPLLTVDSLSVQFESERGTVEAVDDVSFDVEPGETVCLVGESGSGKTVTCESITKLTGDSGQIEGSARFDGADLLSLPDKQLREYRGGRIAYVFQNPQNALDPVYTVREQIVESIREHHDVSKDVARQRAVSLLDDVGIPNPSARADEYPGSFSGGMRQRVLIAMALAGDPDLLVADEPTTALDVTTEAEILDLFADLQRERNTAVLFVTHDLAVVSEIADRIVVMYGGKVMETGTATTVLDQPSHPYTRALLRCLPGRGGKMEPIGGEFPDPTDPPDGCRFHPRCPHAVEACRGRDQPPLHSVTGDTNRVASCVYHSEGFDEETVMGPLFEETEAGGKRASGPDTTADGGSVEAGNDETAAETGSSETAAETGSSETAAETGSSEISGREQTGDGTTADLGPERTGGEEDA
jgi:peptide/nickel transport system ATP-binding protein